MMDSFELNKLIGAFLAAVFVVFTVSLASNAIFATRAPETPGYAIVVAEAETAPQEAGEAVSLAALLHEADPARGQTSFRLCQACHTAEEGGANRVGPNLWDVVNRPIASKEGFSYSAAMREFSQGGSEAWDYEHLADFLRAPRSAVPGTSMAFAGIRDPQQEADLIAFLRTLSQNPAPLPEVADEESGAAEEPSEEAPATEAPAPDPAPVEETPAQEAPVTETPAPQETP